MANDQLTAVGGSGSQTATQSPQSAVRPADDGTQANSVQPGTAASELLNGSSGVTLSPTALSTVDLSTSASQSTTAAITPSPGTGAKPAHHVNPILFVVAGVLLLAAVAVSVVIARTAKTTTN